MMFSVMRACSGDAGTHAFSVNANGQLLPILGHFVFLFQIILGSFCVNIYTKC